MPNICVDGAAVVIVPIPPLVVFKPTDKIPGGKQKLVVITGKPALVKDDVDEWVKNYKSDYISPPFVIPGKVSGDKGNIIALSVKTAEEGKKLVVLSTAIILMLKVDSPAKMPTPTGPQSDPVPKYVANVSFTNAAQTKFDSL